MLSGGPEKDPAGPENGPSHRHAEVVEVAKIESPRIHLDLDLKPVCKFTKIH